MSRQLTSYPWKARQRDIRFNFASKEAASATPFVQYSSSSLRGVCFKNSHADGLHKDTLDVKALRFNRVITEQWGS